MNTLCDAMNFIKEHYCFIEEISRYLGVKAEDKLVDEHQNYEFICPLRINKEELCKGKLTVNKKNNVFYCYYCHTGGDYISFICYLEDISIIEAVNKLLPMALFKYIVRNRKEDAIPF